MHRHDVVLIAVQSLYPKSAAGLSHQEPSRWKMATCSNRPLYITEKSQLKSLYFWLR